jgi:hypothetical protein
MLTACQYFGNHLYNLLLREFLWSLFKEDCCENCATFGAGNTS